MASVNEFGGAEPDRLDSPPLGGVDGWAAAVAAALDNDDTTVDTRVAAAKAAAIADATAAAATDAAAQIDAHEAASDPHPGYLTPVEHAVLDHTGVPGVGGGGPVDSGHDWASVTGGVVTSFMGDGDNGVLHAVYEVHTFGGASTLVVTVAGWLEVLCVAGGGGGGADHGGGGGGGGVLTFAGNVAAGSYPVVVGAAGLAGSARHTYGTDGGNSSVIGLTAIGGGRGGQYNNLPGWPGGCGGGGAAYGSGGAAGNSSQGYPAAAGNNSGSGGGGGAGGPAGVGNQSNGGAGLLSKIDGTARYFGAGGGGSDSAAGAGLGGSGLGGNGNASPGGITAAVAQTGSGGGGNTSTQPGRNGSAGIVIVRFVPADVGAGIVGIIDDSTISTSKVWSSSKTDAGLALKQAADADLAAIAAATLTGDGYLKRLGATWSLDTPAGGGGSGGGGGAGVPTLIQKIALSGAGPWSFDPNVMTLANGAIYRLVVVTSASTGDPIVGARLKAGSTVDSSALYTESDHLLATDGNANVGGFTHSSFYLSHAYSANGICHVDVLLVNPADPAMKTGLLGGAQHVYSGGPRAIAIGAVHGVVAAYDSLQLLLSGGTITGTAWLLRVDGASGGSGSGGPQVVAGGTFSAAGSGAKVNTGVVFDATAAKYELVIVSDNSASANWRAQLKAASTPATSGYNSRRLLHTGVATIAGDENAGGTSEMLLGNGDTSRVAAMTVALYRPGHAAKTSWVATFGGGYGGNTTGLLSGEHSSAVAYDSLDFWPDAGTAAGYWTLVKYPIVPSSSGSGSGASYYATSIPVMTAATAPSGTAADSEHINAGAAAWCAMNPAYNGWLTNGSALPQWISYQYAGAKTALAYGFRPWYVDTFPARTPNAWKFQGSNDGTTWTDLDTRSGFVPASAAQVYVFPITTPASFTRYRLLVSANNGNAYTGLALFSIFTLEDPKTGVFGFTDPMAPVVAKVA